MGIYSNIVNNSAKSVFVESQTYPDSLSILETGYLILEESERNWNTFMKAVGLQELNYFQNTNEDMVYTEANVSEFFSTAIAWFKSLFAKIKGLFDKFIAKITSIVRSDEVFVKKYKNKIIEGAKNLPDTVKFKGYEINEKLHDFKLSTDAGMTNESDPLSFICSYLSIDKKDLKDEKKVDEAITEWKTGTLREELKATLMSLLLQGDICSDEKEFPNMLKTYFIGEKKELDKSYLSSADEFIAIISGAKQQKEAAKETFNTIKDKINKSINAIENIGKDNNSASVKLGKCVIEGLKDELFIDEKAYSVQLECLKKDVAQSKSICVKLIGFAASSKKENVKESTYFQHEKSVSGIELY